MSSCASPTARLSFDELRVIAHVTAAAITPTVIRDPADDAVLACALAASADLIVSGDADLLNLKHFHNIDIVNATDALVRVRT